MKILKDKMPTRAADCSLAFYDKYRGYYICCVRKIGIEPCALTRNKSCPYLTTDPGEGI